MHEFLDIIRSTAQQVAATRQPKGTLVVTSYNPKTHAVKGILMPQEVETGWIPIAVQHAGNGYGILVGPNVGTKDDLKGDQFDIEFEGGDQSWPIAKQKHFSTVDNPPEVQSGEVLIKHEKGGSRLYAKDGSITDTHPSGGTITWDKDGHLTVDTKNKNYAVTTGSGTLTQSTNDGNLA